MILQLTDRRLVAARDHMDAAGGKMRPWIRSCSIARRANASAFLKNPASSDRPSCARARGSTRAGSSHAHSPDRFSERPFQERYTGLVVRGGHVQT